MNGCTAQVTERHEKPRLLFDSSESRFEMFLSPDTSQRGFTKIDVVCTRCSTDELRIVLNVEDLAMAILTQKNSENQALGTASARVCNHVENFLSWPRRFINQVSKVKRRWLQKGLENQALGGVTEELRSLLLGNSGGAKAE